MTEQFLNTYQISRRIGIAEDTVRIWLRDGRLPGIKIGTAWRMPESELIRWMDNKKKAAKIVFTDVPCPQYERD